MIVGERIESGLKIKRIQGALSIQASGKESSRNYQMEEEDETNIIEEALQAPSPPPTSYGQYMYATTIQWQQPLLFGPQYQQSWAILLQTSEPRAEDIIITIRANTYLEIIWKEGMLLWIQSL